MEPKSEIASKAASSNRSIRIPVEEGRGWEYSGPNFLGSTPTSTLSIGQDVSPKKHFLLFKSGPREDLTCGTARVGDPPSLYTDSSDSIEDSLVDSMGFMVLPLLLSR